VNISILKAFCVMSDLSMKIYMRCFHYQAVNLMEDIYPPNMCVWAKAKLLWEPSCLRWVCTSLQNIGRTDRYGSNVRQLFPRMVYFKAWILTVDRGRIPWAERAISLGSYERNMDLIQNWCCFASIDLLRG